MVTTKKYLNDNKNRFKDKAYKIVTPNFMEDCISSKRLVSDSPYLLEVVTLRLSALLLMAFLIL